MSNTEIANSIIVYVRGTRRGCWNLGDTGIKVKQLGFFAKALVARKLGVDREAIEFRLV